MNDDVSPHAQEVEHHAQLAVQRLRDVSVLGALVSTLPYIRVPRSHVTAPQRKARLLKRSRELAQTISAAAPASNSAVAKVSTCGN